MQSFGCSLRVKKKIMRPLFSHGTFSWFYGGNWYWENCIPQGWWSFCVCNAVGVKVVEKLLWCCCSETTPGVRYSLARLLVNTFWHQSIASAKSCMLESLLKRMWFRPIRQGSSAVKSVSVTEQHASSEPPLEALCFAESAFGFGVDWLEWGI